MDSGQRPLYSKYESSNQNPYGSGDPYYNASTGYLPPQKPKKAVSNWIKFGIPVAVIVIVAVVVGVVVGTRNNDDNSSSSGKGGSNNPAAAESSLVDQKNIGRFPTATDTEYFVPLYPSTVCFFFLLRFRHLAPAYLANLSRLIPLPSRHPHLWTLIMSTWRGQMTPSNLQIQHQPVFDQTDLASLHLHTSGRRYRTSSQTTLTFLVGTRLFSTMRLNTIISHLLSISWMVEVAFSTMLVKLKCV